MIDSEEDIGKKLENKLLTVCGIMNKEISDNIFNAMIINREVSNNVKAETFNGHESQPKIKGQGVYKVRFHRGGLKESMETYFEPKDWNDFVSHCVEDNRYIIVDSIDCHLYYDESDTRIGWNETWMITAKFSYSTHDYPIGFSDRNIMELKEIVTGGKND